MNAIPRCERGADNPMSDWEMRKQREEIARRAMWSKWSDEREQLLTDASEVWVPLEDLREVLNRLPGPSLTEMDVYQRLRAIWTEPYASGAPDEALRDECFAKYATEKVKGTEFIAILAWLRDWIGEASMELYNRREQEQARQRVINDDHQIRSGANHPQGATWVRAIGLPGYYCRKKGRLFRYLTDDDRSGTVTEIETIESMEGIEIGEFRTFTEAAKAVATLVRRK